jgi:hypothetical protein
MFHNFALICNQIMLKKKNHVYLMSFLELMQNHVYTLIRCIGSTSKIRTNHARIKCLIPYLFNSKLHASSSLLFWWLLSYCLTYLASIFNIFYFSKFYDLSA